jgi:tetratricopeptide (TPR) repeat protein
MLSAAFYKHSVKELGCLGYFSTLLFLFFGCINPFICFAESIKDEKSAQSFLSSVKEFDTQSIIETISALQNTPTRLCPSHISHPGYDSLTFIYDSAVNALILKLGGYQSQAEEILNYFSYRLRLPDNEVKNRADTNGVYGILKLFKPINSSQQPVRSLVNAVDISCCRRQGRGYLEFCTTPGPTAFLIFAMLQVNTKKYYTDALILGEALLAMQDSEGGVHDGDRAPDRIHTEPHVDAYSAFLMLYKVTGNEKWMRAADKAYDWFIRNVYHAKEGVIDQGLWSGKPNTIFATDVYSWTMAGPCGDKFTPKALKMLTETMLNRSLVKITLTLPGLSEQTVILCDFSDAGDARVKDIRLGFHPMGSVEWTGGVILALQKNAVRFYSAQDHKTAAYYKALAEVLFAETMKCFYSLGGQKKKITFYATGQGVEIGPFGSIENKLCGGWKTPFFYVRENNSNGLIKGGSTVGAWPLLPRLGLNPFMLNDRYQETYKQIIVTQEDLNTAKAFLNYRANAKSFSEVLPEEISILDIQIVEPQTFNNRMWQALENAYMHKGRNEHIKAEIYFEQVIYWAKKIINDPVLLGLAKRDNLEKQKDFGGIISYPWGVTYPDNDHALHYAILRYPLLNEVATAMYGLAIAYFELECPNEAKYWIQRIIEEVPLHQIADIERDKDIQHPLIRGYWNALVSWEDNPGGYQRDEEMQKLYRQVLKNKGLSSAKPKVIILPKN